MARKSHSLRSDAPAILLVWASTLALTLFLAPRGDVSLGETFYYSVYNALAGALVGFRLFDRMPKLGFAPVALRGSCTLLLGTLINEAAVEPLLFGDRPINAKGFYYGLTDVLTVTGFFVLIRLAHWQTRFREGADSGRPEADAASLLVRIGSGTRLIRLRDVLYLAAERDFTRIVCVNGEHFASESLKSLLDRSADFGLIRVHKSFAVNLSHVEQMTRAEVLLGEYRVPVGRRYRPTFAETWRAWIDPLAVH